MITPSLLEKFRKYKIGIGEIKRRFHSDIPMIEKIMTIISFGTMNEFPLSNVRGMILLKIGMMYLL